MKRIKDIKMISIAIDTWDDVFSDFDPRPYSQRRVSDDFLSEIRKAVKDKTSGMLEVKFLVPEPKRNPATETVIKKRLRQYFKNQAERVERDIRKVYKQGALFVAAGVMLMFVAALLLFYGLDARLMFSFIIILLEPGGWFLFWEGLNLMVFRSRLQKPDLELARKMSKCQIVFFSY